MIPEAGHLQQAILHHDVCSGPEALGTVLQDKLRRRSPTRVEWCVLYSSIWLPCKVTRRLSRLDAHRALETFATLAKQKVAREQCKRCPTFLFVVDFPPTWGCFSAILSQGAAECLPCQCRGCGL